jgi:hypothetical protein
VPGPEASDEDVEILRHIKLRPEPFATARDIEPDMSVGYKQTRNRLDDLSEAGLLNVKMVGTTKVYWLSDEGKIALSQAD